MEGIQNLLNRLAGDAAELERFNEDAAARRRLMDEAGLSQVKRDVVEAAVASGDSSAFLDRYGGGVRGRSRLDDIGIVC